VNKMCGRIDKHLPHHWQSHKILGHRFRETYYCKGYVIIEGGARVDRRAAR